MSNIFLMVFRGRSHQEEFLSLFREEGTNHSDTLRTDRHVLWNKCIHKKAI